MRKFVKVITIWSVCFIAVAILAVAITVPVVVSNARAAEQKNATIVATQQNAYALLDTSAGKVAYSHLIDNDWSGFCHQLGVVSNTATSEGVTSTTIRCVDSEDNIVLLSNENDGNVYSIGVRDSQGDYKEVASFEAGEGYSMFVDLGNNRPPLHLTPIGAIYLSQTVGHFVNGTFE